MLRPRNLDNFSKVWKSGDLDYERSFEAREIEEGDVIAQGVIGVPGYGQTPRERAQFSPVCGVRLLDVRNQA